MSIKEFMAMDHEDCDALFVIMEKAASEDDWSVITKTFNEFNTAMERHLSMEEDELFPAFEQASGMVQGPTLVMRMEHGQMRDLFKEMREATENQNRNDFLGAADTLLILMQQHNAKEEMMLYPMMDNGLLASMPVWLEKLEKWKKT